MATKSLHQILTGDQAWFYHAVPKEQRHDSTVIVVDAHYWRDDLQDELEAVTGTSVLLEQASAEVVNAELSRLYKQNSSVSAAKNNSSSASFSASNESDFLVRLINEAQRLRSSDIHIESYELKSRVRMRIDGLLAERYTIDAADYPSLINKIKIRANLDIAEKRLPQDGRIFFSHEGFRIDIRVSVLPTLHGEKVVLRLLNNDASNIDIRTLGFSEKQLQDYSEGIRKPHGILLISGPTGSGKTTTLYATLKLLNKEGTNILTVEDPVEYTLEGINQVQLKESIGLTFAGALRTFLRQDPDIIMLGEIRDGETAQMAVRAALTGHLVLSTIHTNSAWGTISRLQDMGVPSFLIANTLNTSVAQRLVRLLCPQCKVKMVFKQEYFPSGFDASTLEYVFTANGCDQCYHTGYKGRKAIYEVVPIDVDFSEAIRTQVQVVNDLFEEKGISTLQDSAMHLLRSGFTSPDEVYSILSQSSH
jgi:general secretion pathway protein E/type IV pilus assembly protein PilB